MMIFGVMLEPHWWWLILGLALAIAEIVVPGVFLIWIGAAAALTGLVALLLPIPVAADFVFFAVAAIAMIYAGRRWLAAHPIETSDPLLNNRAGRLIGRNVVVVEEISGGEGRVKVDDGVWNASGPDAAAGTRVRIVGVEGERLKVEPAEV